MTHAHSAGERTKRVLDSVAAGALLVVLSPVAAVVAIAVRASMGSPVIFSQERVGLDGRVFVLRKFRTMRPADTGLELESDGQRITRTGAFLRSTSLDELPSLWNVLIGDMSLVGPRPLLVQYLERYTTRQARRHEVRPGVTGLAQVSGRNALSWQERLELDVQYVDQRSLSLDLRILARTIVVVLRRTGVTDSGGVSMSEFRGEAG